MKKTLRKLDKNIKKTVYLTKNGIKVDNQKQNNNKC